MALETVPGLVDPSARLGGLGLPGTVVLVAIRVVVLERRHVSRSGRRPIHPWPQTQDAKRSEHLVGEAGLRGRSRTSRRLARRPDPGIDPSSPTQLMAELGAYEAREAVEDAHERLRG